jgi:hypothetical protein
MARSDRHKRRAAEGAAVSACSVCHRRRLIYDWRIIGSNGEGVMRFKAALMATIVTAGLLAGCRGGGEGERQALIDEGVKSCVEGFNKSGGSAAGSNMDGQRICQCALEKMTEGKSVEEIRTISKQNEPSQADLQAMGACVVEEAQSKGVLGK